jgi:RNA polymerase sigma factor (sigma-70 family)
VRRYEQLAFRTAWLITGSAPDAEEAAQDGFTKAYFALGRFRTGAPFRPWLLQIVANEARNRRKSAGRHAAHALPLDDVAPVADDASPELAALRSDERRRLLDAVNTLREDERAVVACRYFLGLSESEIADTLACPRGTVKSRLSRALAHLRAIMTISEPAPPSDGKEVADD